MGSQSVELKRGGLLAELWVWSRVYPLSRPRVRAKSCHVYQPKTNQRALLAELGAYPALQIKRPVAVQINVFLAREKPHHQSAARTVYGDVDNLAKAVLDALVANGILYDDIYVVDLAITKCLAPEDACQICIYESQTTEEAT